MLCPLSYAPSRPDIRGERLTLLTAVARIGRRREIDAVRLGTVTPARRLLKVRSPLEIVPFAAVLLSPAMFDGALTAIDEERAGLLAMAQARSRSA